uniref:ATP synthase F0 subunit 8 n=1 Tax=Urolophus aurantiacus TaxID=195339 RepID=UPI0028FC9685|nr:ATP synthase F0 subunit 8 [Urolophus aurantiacus]WND64991.1 ATP synthase F0 subunit 8 [Urolophus aurantiacus]
MPQLNPSPWFLIFLFTWLFFLATMPTKVVHHLFNNPPTTKNIQKSKPTPWNWPWT